MPTPERDLLRLEVIRLWNDEQSAGLIARRMKLTRNMVIGIVNRARASGYITRPKHEPTPAEARRRAPAKKPKPKLRLPEQPELDLVPPEPASLAADEPVAIVMLFPPPKSGPGPKTLIDAPLYTCRVVVGRNERGQDLYCCEPIYRQKDGSIGHISVCEAHKSRYFQTRRAPTNTVGNLPTNFRREPRTARKFFAFGRTMEGHHG